jgi:hypothetical protein
MSWHSRDLTDIQVTVTYITLLIFFFLAALVPACIGFAICMNTKGPGKTSDATFWFLIQGSIMTILGNLMAVVPLIKKSWFSPAYNLMWTLFGFGLLSAIVAIVIYPLLNLGWSALFSFFASVASAASVPVITQASAKGRTAEKLTAMQEKKDQ